MSAHLAFPDRVRTASGVELRLAEAQDAETIAQWTRAPEVHREWGGREVSLDEARAKYTGLRSPEVVSYVISEHGCPLGYIQAWQRADRYGLDLFIAAEAQGRGLGPRAARALAEELTAAGWVPLTVDPALSNTRAIRAWRSAGFRETGEFGTDDGVVTQVMAFVGGPAACLGVSARLPGGALPRIAITPSPGAGTGSGSRARPDEPVGGG